ncbi:MAG: hypothetical protein U0V72_10995 [Cytophagales bacterium]
MKKFFKNTNLKTNKEYFQYLVNLAYQDGHLDKSEIVFLCTIGEKLGLGTSEIGEYLQNRIPFLITQVPLTDTAKFEQLFDIVNLAMVDDHLEENEIEFCTRFAKRLGYKEDIVGELVRLMYDDIENGIAKQLIQEDINRLLKKYKC